MYVIEQSTGISNREFLQRKPIESESTQRHKNEIERYIAERQRERERERERESITVINIEREYNSNYHACIALYTPFFTVNS